MVTMSLNYHQKSENQQPQQNIPMNGPFSSSPY
ncbi:hypothetical protein SBY92_004731 [Candida maltosa Xu316]